MMKTSLLAACSLCMALNTTQAADEVIYFDASEPQLVDNQVIVMDGVRVEGFGLSAETDALRLEYRFDPESLNFVLDTNSLVVYDEIGMFYDYYMALNVENIAPPFISNGEIYVQTSETSYEFSATEAAPFVAEFVLEPGHVISWYISKVRRDYSFEFSGPNMNVVGQGLRGVNRVFEPIKIMQPGTYRLQIKPTDPAEDGLAFSINTFNNNSDQLIEIKDGDTVDEPFTRNTHEYSKYLVTVPPTATFRLAAPKRDDGRIVMLNRQGKVVHKITGQEEFLYTETADSPQTYYVFVEGVIRYRSDVAVTLPEPPAEEAGDTPAPEPQPRPTPEPTPEVPVVDNPDEPIIDENLDELIFDDEPTELENLGTGV